MNNLDFLVQEIQRYSKFTIDVFTYCRNKIIKLDRDIKLDINIYEYYDNRIAAFYFPNTIVVYLMTSIRGHNFMEEYIKSEIIHTMIHELFHANQQVNTDIYLINKVYNDNIEQGVEYQTAKFLYDNYDEIKQLFNVNLSSLDLFIESNLSRRGKYEVMTDFDYISKIISYLYYDEYILHLIEKTSNVIININDNSVIIKEHSKYKNILDLLYIIDQEALKYNRYIVRMSKKETGNTLIVNIKITHQMYTDIFKINDKKE